MELCLERIETSTTDVQSVGDGLSPISRLHFDKCSRFDARNFISLHHSRLPYCQEGPWQFSFKATIDDVWVAAALWNNPSARTLPHHWLELRRLACSPDAPRNTASKFIGWMVRYFKKNHPTRERCISYQDLSVHTGTIYRASGWHVAYVSKPRVRDRSPRRVGTNRAYRRDANGLQAASAAKARWEIEL